MCAGVSFKTHRREVAGGVSYLSAQQTTHDHNVQMNMMVMVVVMYERCSHGETQYSECYI